MATYKFYYFNGRGRGEVSRLIFAAAGQKFEDVRINFNEWASRQGEMPLGEMPVLEYNGVKLPQSMSIARFLAKQFNLAGKDNFEQAKVDAVADTIVDMFSQLIPIHFEEDEDKKKEKKQKFFDEELPIYFKKFETLAKAYGEGGNFFVGNHLTWCDLLAYDVFQYLVEMNSNVFNGYAWLQKNRETVEKIPAIAAYLKNRSQS